jgi:hypothetical protein
MYSLTRTLGEFLQRTIPTSSKMLDLRDIYRQHRMQQSLEQAMQHEEVETAVDDIIAEADGVMVPMLTPSRPPKRRHSHRIVSPGGVLGGG